MTERFKLYTEILLAVLYCCFTDNIRAQDSMAQWVNKNAIDLQDDTFDQVNDFGFLDELVSGKCLVGLGEASHGTEEFFKIKSRISKHLISSIGFKVLAFEMDKEVAMLLDRFVRTGNGDIRKELLAYGLYNSLELYKLFQWIYRFNSSLPDEEMVRIMGFDSQSYWSDPLARDSLMADNFNRQYDVLTEKAILWGHNIHLAKDTTMAAYRTMGYHLASRYNDQYYLIMTDTYKGTYHVLKNGKLKSYPFSGQANSTAAALGEVKYPAFFINMNNRSNPWREKQYMITNLYANWQGDPTPLPVLPGASFDALIYIRETTPSIPLDDER
ncbi:MAG TPA: erythromycin esterase family protein [Sphingobacterium sp.]|nr:erythromycin esterase family protein [Sphingobacterium sp.]